MSNGQDVIAFITNILTCAHCALETNERGGRGEKPVVGPTREKAATLRVISSSISSIDTEVNRDTDGEARRTKDDAETSERGGRGEKPVEEPAHENGATLLVISSSIPSIGVEVIRVIDGEV